MKTAWRRNVVSTSLDDITASGLVCHPVLLPVTRSHGGETPCNAICPIVTLTDYITFDLSGKDPLNICEYELIPDTFLVQCCGC